MKRTGGAAPKNQAADGSRWQAATLLCGGLALVAAGTFAALSLGDLRRDPRRVGAIAAPGDGAETGRASFLRPIRHVGADGVRPSLDGTNPPTSAPPLPPETPPWEATPENTPPVAEGFVPAWKVRPPPPDPSVPPPPAPREPPEPARHRPPMDNPGGVNGDRPERPMPGLE